MKGSRWIKIRTEALRHPKMVGMADMLEVPLAHAVGLMLTLWAYAAENMPDGDISSLTDREIARAAGWKGDVELFVHALVYCNGTGVGFVDGADDGRLMLAGWGEDIIPAPEDMEGA